MKPQDRRWRQPAGFGAALILIGLIGISLLAPLLAPADPLHAVSGESLRPPSLAHPLGTDLLGRDIWSRVLYGGRRTLLLGVLALAVAAIPGTLIGLLAGYNGGFLDRAIGVVLDALLAFPGLLLALIVITLTGGGLFQVALAIGLAALPGYARVVRAAVRSARTQPYIGAAVALGADTLHILRVHIVPALMPTILSFGAVTFSWAILDGSALTFLGFTENRAIPDWGTMLADGRGVFRTSPWGALAPGALIMLTIFAVNQIATALAEPPSNSA